MTKKIAALDSGLLHWVDWYVGLHRSDLPEEDRLVLAERVTQVAIDLILEGVEDGMV